jgi:hypothetical protein
MASPTHVQVLSTPSCPPLLSITEETKMQMKTKAADIASQVHIISIKI